MDWLQRTEMLLGSESISKLHSAHVWVFGIGGVGSYTAMALARSGVGNLTLVDSETVDITNINRQLEATQKTIGEQKTKALAKMLLDVNPNINLTLHNTFYISETAQKLNFSTASYVVDAIDTVTAKLLIIENATKWGVPVISSMGTGNKLDATRFEVSDISKTSMCPLARVMRRELKQRGINHLKVVYSKEMPHKPGLQVESQVQGRNAVPASCSFVPPVCGMILAGEVVCDICEIDIR